MHPLQVLIVEDNPDDAELLLRELRRAGFEPNWSRVDTEAAFLLALEKRPEIILSDYWMPQFGGLQALELLRASGMDIPFILISGTVGEDVAVGAMRDGAADYLIKDRIARLPSAVKSALQQTVLRAERARTEETLREKVAMLDHANQEREALIAKLKSALSEKTVLLKEVHHRVKNNMAVIVGLLEMQAATIDNESARLAFEESQQRVLSMALIHEYLYATEHLDRVNFGKYVRELVNKLLATYSIKSGLVGVCIDVQDIDLTVDRAIPCGLILNELISNALKYAFPNGARGEIRVRFGRLESGQLSLSCRDNGVGIPDSFDWRNPHSLGLRIVSILADQVDGDLMLDRSEGNSGFEMHFPAA